jgi:hypothetical protein
VKHPRKGVAVPGRVGILEYALIDGQWQRLREHIPDQLAPDVEEELRANIGLCCLHFFDQCRVLRDGAATAAALKPPGGRGELSTFDKLAKGLRMAADAWAEMGGETVPYWPVWLDQLRAESRLKQVGPWEASDFYSHFEIGMEPAEAIDFAIKYIALNDGDARRMLWREATEQKSFERYKRRTAGKFFDDRMGPLSDLGVQIEAMARDAERRLKDLSALGERVTMTAHPELVRSVRTCLQDAGLRPAATNRVYASSDSKAKSGNGNPTWFQKFMAELNNSVLGINGWGPLGPGDLPAFYSEITRACGDAKPGNP